MTPLIAVGSTDLGAVEKAEVVARERSDDPPCLPACSFLFFSRVFLPMEHAAPEVAA